MSVHLVVSLIHLRLSRFNARSSCKYEIQLVCKNDEETVDMARHQRAKDLIVAHEIGYLNGRGRNQVRTEPMEHHDGLEERYH